MEFRILGPLEVVEDGRPLPLGKGKQRALLAVLLLHRNGVVSTDRLIDELWGESAPPTAATALQGYVSQLRKQLGAERLETRSPGYRFRLEPGELDVERFEGLLAEGQVHEALALFRGPPLADFAYEPFAQGEIVRLEDLRLAALEQRIEADLASGRHTELVGELEALVQAYPLRERFRAQLMLALYRSGRQAEALETFKAARHTLVEELGIEPSEELKELQKRILAQDSELSVARPRERAEAARLPPATPADPPRKVRKPVTILFCDLVDSTALGERFDPEVVEGVFESLYETIRTVVDRHGGRVLAHSGDGVMAVFGLPRVHEDDALRALRAANELPEAIRSLSAAAPLQARVGVNTGEVIAGGESLVAGDPVNVAARLQKTARPDEIVFGDSTWRLVRDHVRAEPLQLELRGKSKPVRAWRLVELLPEPPPSSLLDAPLIGRERSLARLQTVLADVAAEGTPHIFTLLGPAGIGKSRLTAEFTRGAETDARVLVGRCLPYGDGITYWPLAEILRGLGDLESTVRDVVGAGAELDTLGNLVGRREAAPGRDAIFWATRRLFIGLTRDRPLILVFEDIHWAEPTLLDLIDHVAETGDGPLLLLCVARPELLEDRPGWGGGKRNASSLLLEPLSEVESDTLIEALLAGDPLDPDTRRRVSATAEGNPLFVEQILAMRRAEGDGHEFEVPTTIQALLAARIDRLGPGERAVVEAAAVVGKEFWTSAVYALVEEEAGRTVEPHLDTLVRKGLVAPARSVFLGEDVYRFRHILIRDAAYRSIPKQSRAVLHERFADWLTDAAGEDVAEYDEILGYHLEQAHSLGSELHLDVDGLAALANRAAAHLFSAADRAEDNEELSASLKLNMRGLELLDGDDPRRARRLVFAARSARGSGDLGRAAELEDDASEAARRTGDRHAAGLIAISRAIRRVLTDPSPEARDDLGGAARAALHFLGDNGDDGDLASAWRIVGWVEGTRSAYTESLAAYERSREHALRGGFVAKAETTVIEMLMNLTEGPLPVPTAIDRAEALLAGVTSPVRRARGETSLAVLYAHGGRFDDGRRLVDQAGRVLHETSRYSPRAEVLTASGILEFYAGDLDASEADFRRAVATWEQAGSERGAAQAAHWLAVVLAELGELAEAEQSIDRAIAGATDVIEAELAGCVKGLIAAFGGEKTEAEKRAERAVTSVTATEALVARAEVARTASRVFAATGDDDRARALAKSALALARRKQSIPEAQRAEGQLEALAKAPKRPPAAPRAASP